ncbi:DUF2617 family protein [Oscillatoriales cyanobacterium LEGE 11467]|uniref:DUF2617 family protein n=1 Tax=Zarconia navalis LEGE 11467 TaxID=1828826 RepID=A0A928VZV3_9CYAN|nr:DUF2617 family protein [Zarconia navalis]MBE9040715.1 DUF2617 family protein [Zarconia navalis LEGE 11467]
METATPIDVPYQDVSSARLCYSLLRGTPDLEVLQPISTIDLVVPTEGQSISVTIGILGASHFMSVRFPDDRAIAEVLACLELREADAIARLSCLDLSGTLTQVCEKLNQGTYRFQVWCQDWSETGCQEKVERLAAQIRKANGNTEAGLAFEFPSSETDRPLDRPPVTLVLLRIRNSSPEVFELQTVHSYPNEGRVVFSHSSYE